ncbi:hypothetical protein M438DRAFT_18467 [Aureobasidium pullulans EXF-150]|uniref:Secreted protein n=1 Tax=Aureobasidium pullulans EXF-150 TaxID=1043002 RepID=A0A074XWY4_AURPU|nr:uncharacterized protein M438DRAFT_18467 [Aureobasidium pullulans EXF-150]KEQ90010.1 hypothetical protein M438DRAFT_18467 [Aureobasidium pullulans EXF-150]
MTGFWSSLFVVKCITACCYDKIFADFPAHGFKENRLACNVQSKLTRTAKVDFHAAHDTTAKLRKCTNKDTLMRAMEKRFKTCNAHAESKGKDLCLQRTFSAACLVHL